MSLISKILSGFHILIAKSRPLVYLTAKIRNQCELILRKRFAVIDMNPHKNGEYNLLNSISKYCHTFFDIGANKGEWTSYILTLNDLEKKLYLFEPGLEALKILNTKFHGFSNIHIMNKAVSDKAEELDFHEEKAAGEMSSLVPNWANNLITVTKVKTTTIDEEIKNNNLDKVDFLKIDIEGYDLKALNGAKKSINNQKIGFIQFEYNSCWFNVGSSLKDAYELLKKSGYSIYLIKEKGLYIYDIELYGDFYAFSNFIAIAPRNLPLINHLIKGKA